ncbi:MAG: signal peptidase II [Chloroflexota bacterium]|nr:signal peptidase II [Chloroflexota bacterium]
MDRVVDRPALPIAVGLGVVVLDQASKAIVVDRLGPGAARQVVELVGSTIALRYVENTGAAFGLLRGQGPALTAASVLILAGLALLYRRLDSRSAWTAVAIGGIAGGAVGNLLDRARLGYVVDFVSVGPWPTFNLADSAISVGVVVFAWRMLFDHDTLPERAKPGSAPSRSRPSAER